MYLKKTFTTFLTTFSLLGTAGCSSEELTKDPIEQVRVVLDGRLTYEQIDSMTTRAILEFELESDDETRSRMWSSVLAIAEKTGLKGEDIMLCASERPSASVKFSDMVGICGATMATQ